MFKLSLHLLKGVLILAFLSAPILVKGQLVVNPSVTATDLAESLIGSGVTISGITLNCPGGAYGKFDATATALPLDSGIMLTSGQVINAIGPNDESGSGTSNGWPGDPDLDNIPGVLGTNDACVLEFDAEVTADTIKFNYIFGSEEYLEFVGSFNDVFAFWISGPGIVGMQNMALVPVVGVPVSINSVNDVSNPAYYVNNGDGFTTPFSTDPSYIQYDGQTVVLEAKASVIPCQTYHLKLAVADDLDFILDSGVFIEAGSLVSTGVSLVSSTSVGFGFDNAIEGCVDGLIDFIPDVVPTDTQVVKFLIAGTATNSVDYITIVDSLIFLPGDTMKTVIISPIVDPLPEGIESVTIYVIDPCAGLPYDSVTVFIQDAIELELNAVPDVTVCPGDTVTLSVTGGLDYIWSPAGSIADPLADTTEIYPPSPTWYLVETTLGTCSRSDSIFVDVSAGPEANAGPDIDLCIGYDVNLSGTGGGNYSWDPPTDLSSTIIANPLTSTLNDITYSLTVTDAAGCWDVDSVRVIVHDPPVADASPTDDFICPGDELVLSATGGTYYSWSPSIGLDDPISATPILTAVNSNLYQVIVSDIYGCADTAYVDIVVDIFPTVDAGNQVIIDLGESTTLNGMSSQPWIWSPEGTLDDPTLLNPTATPILNTWYVITATSPAGCVTADSVWVILVSPPPVIIPSAFTPDGDGLNDLITPVVLLDIEGEIDFMIMDRWGNKVFESNDAQKGWDGTYHGKVQEIGSYVYIFVATNSRGEEFNLTGTITLLR
jgi:gliding motility-associated-like protein